MARIWEILQIGFLSMFYAEVLSGSSQLWFIQPFSWLITLPLYMFHVLFFLNISQRLNLHRFSQQYLLGTIFGLYESWITKVLWSGYPSSGMREPILGLFGGIAIFEFSVLVFFFHPIFAYILPVYSYQQLMRSYNSHQSLFLKIKPTRIIKLFAILTFLFGTTTFVFNLGLNLISIIMNLVGALLLILLNHLIITHKDIPYSSDHIIFENKGFILTCFYLIILYIFTYFVLAPEYIPDMSAFVPIVVFYIIPIVVLYRSPKMKLDETSSFCISRQQLLMISGLFIVSIIILAIIPPITTILMIFVQFTTFLIGPVFYIYMNWKCIYPQSEN